VLDPLWALLVEEDVQYIAEAMSFARDARACAADIVFVAAPIGMETPMLYPAPPGMEEACGDAWSTIWEVLTAYLNPAPTD
jgi:hypothetical protein